MQAFVGVNGNLRQGFDRLCFWSDSEYLDLGVMGVRSFPFGAVGSGPLDLGVVTADSRVSLQADSFSTM